MIELRGIIKSQNHGHERVELVVQNGRPDRYEKHLMGVDIAPNRGRIITFLASMYDVKPGDIVWPDHIDLKTA